MGQGYSLTTLSAGSAGIDVPELADLTYEKSMGTARFMKSIRARAPDGVVVAKVVMKPYASMKLDSYVKKILRERKILSDVPNALPYHRVLETSSNGYLVRQWIYSSLYDRLSTRPFLEDIEKKWLSFQLLCAVRDCHARNVYHGDIKTENCLVTSWNWLYLSDFSSSFKPTYLPEDNPADFSFYFDTSGRRTCYLAPERFLSAGEAEGKGRVNWAMDIFSLGCVIAELFVESPIFSLSSLFKYRKGEFDPNHAYLSRIEDKDVRDLVSHMIQVEPESRYSADEYLTFWRHKAFPEYFYSFLHQYMYLMTDQTSGRSPVTAGQRNLGEPDERIERVYYDFDKISYFLGYEDTKKRLESKHPVSRFGNDLFPLHIDIPNNRHRVSIDSQAAPDDGTLLFLALVVSSMRSTARATARIHALELILAFTERLTDEAKLDRALPYVVDMLKDPSDYVRVAALRTMTQILTLVSVVSPVNAHIFPEYIIPRIQQIPAVSATKSTSLFRATYASCLAVLAHTADRFSNKMQALRADGSLPSADPEAEDGDGTYLAYQDLYDVARGDLLTFFESQTKGLLTDSNPSVRRAFLGSVPSLCVFFGSTKTSDVLLSHLNTYLNDRDWMLRCAFFQTIVAVAVYVGGTSLEEFILPLMVQALTDPEEFVVDRVLRSFASMARLGLFQPSRTWELVDICARFTMHPNLWIREAATHFISAATTYLSVVETQCIVAPLIQAYVRTPPSDFVELKMLDALKRPLPRSVFDQALGWATNVENGIFWKPAQQQRTFSFGPRNDALPIITSKELTPNVLSKIPKNDEDDQWIKRLRSAGMTYEDEFKLVALREYIWRVAKRKQREDQETSPSKFHMILPLKDLGITPQTVFFDHDPKLFNQGISPKIARRDESEKQTHTIADALLDASTAMDDPLQRRKMSHINSHRARSNILSDLEASESRRGSSEAPTPLSASPARRTANPGSALESDNHLRVPRPVPNGSPTIPDGVSSSPSDLKLTEHNHPLSRKGSAISLMNRGDQTAKALAETSTTSANAFGTVDGYLTKASSAQPQLGSAQEQKRPPEFKFQAAHTYDGTDPSILKLLDNVYLENFPIDAEDFGPMVPPLSRRQPIKRANAQGPVGPWRPEGTLTAVFGEHTGAVTRVVVAPDHAFFITGSDDGSVKVWDSARLERNLAHRSRQTHKHAPGAKVSSLTFIENTHCFVSTGTDGSINVVRVDYTEANGSTKYAKLQTLRVYQLEEGEYAVWSEHFKADAQSVLVMATNQSRVIALELKTMDVLYILENPVHHGPPTCFCLDRKRHWLLLGTSHGVLDLWDLRFQLRLKEWGLSGGSPIHRITLHPVRGLRRNRVCIAGGTGQGDVTVWDLEKMLCREAFRIGGCKEGYKTYEPWKIDEDRPEGMLGRFATSLEPNASSGADRGVRAIAVGAHITEEGAEPRHGFFVSGGPDRKVRLWDMDRIEASMVISGLDEEEGKPSFNAVQPTPDLTLINEQIPKTSAKEVPGPAAGGGGGSSKASANSAAKRETFRPTKSTVVSLQQQQLLRSHLAPVLDVALLEYPYGMVISADKSGVIFVYQ